jgi:antitoxin ParD1/3/4
MHVVVATLRSAGDMYPFLWARANVISRRSKTPTSGIRAKASVWSGVRFATRPSTCAHSSTPCRPRSRACCSCTHWCCPRPRSCTRRAATFESSARTSPQPTFAASVEHGSTPASLLISEGIQDAGRAFEGLAKFANKDILRAMGTMNISLPDAMRDFVDTQVAERGYGTSSEYVRDLIRREQDRLALRTVLLDGAAAPIVAKADKAFFDELRAYARSSMRATVLTAREAEPGERLAARSASKKVGARKVAKRNAQTAGPGGEVATRARRVR